MVCNIYYYPAPTTHATYHPPSTAIIGSRGGLTIRIGAGRDRGRVGLKLNSLFQGTDNASAEV